LLRHGAAVRQPASQPVIKEMPGSLASGTPYISRTVFSVVLFNTATIFSAAQFFTGLCCFKKLILPV
jgi:hypothetical protein